jgi:hypothetical protein
MKKHIWKIDLIVILVSVFVLMGLVGYARPLVIAPLDGYESSSDKILFEFDRADVLLIDDNMDFTTPKEYGVSEEKIVRLDPGVYYWKVKGVLGSEVRTFTVNSRVELELVETEDGVAVVNAGNVRLNVDVYDGEELVERKKLSLREESEIRNQESVKIVGEQDG